MIQINQWSSSVRPDVFSRRVDGLDPAELAISDPAEHGFVHRFKE